MEHALKMCQTTILSTFTFGGKAQGSDLTHCLEDEAIFISKLNQNSWRILLPAKLDARGILTELVQDFNPNSIEQVLTLVIGFSKCPAI